MKNGEKCNVGFIGCGQLMTHQHIQNTHYSQINRVHTLCDIDTARLDMVAGMYPPLKKTVNYKDMLRDPEVQLVVIAMKPEMHAKFAIEALKAGKNVYVEKPMGVTMAESRRIARTAKDTGLRLTTGFNRRFAPIFNDLKPYLNPREGGLTMFYRIADRERWDRADWPRILHEVVHIFDILCYFTDSEPTTIYANQGFHHNDNIITLSFADKSIATILSTGRTECITKEFFEVHWDWKAITAEDFIEARYYHVPDAPVVRHYAGRTTDGTRGKDFVEKFGTADGLEVLREMKRQGAQVFDDCLSGKITKEQIVSKASGYIQEKGWGPALDEMGLSILENRKPRNATPEDGIRTTVLSEAAEKSIKTGRAIRLDPKKWTV